MNNIKETIINNFTKIYHISPNECYFSPGRINIIGEHIDYNGGHVFPMAISLGIYACVSFTYDSKVQVVSDGYNDNQIISFDINDYQKTNDFTTYIKGVIDVMKKDLKVIDKGFNLYLYSTLPSSSGLSSSACLELLISHILNDHFKLSYSNFDLVLISQKAEREYALVNCGIMDQFAIGMGKENKAIFLDCDIIEYKYIDYVSKDTTLVIINSCKPRMLVESKYNERRSECEKAYSILSQVKEKNCLCSYSIDDLKVLSDSTLYKRALHCITEEQRVINSLEACMKQDFKTLGKLLKESHASLRDNYEVTGLHLDTICSKLNESPYVYGARMTGAGFGGCCIAIFNTTDLEIINKVMDDANVIYKEVTGISFKYYLCKSSDNTHKLEMR